MSDHKIIMENWRRFKNSLLKEDENAAVGVDISARNNVCAAR